MKGAFILVCVIAVACGMMQKFAGPKGEPVAEAPASAPQAPASQGKAGATYVSMEGGQPGMRLTPAARAKVDQFSSAKVVLFGASWCTYCAAERKTFSERGIKYVEIDVERDPEAMRFMTDWLGVPGVPATVIGTRLIPGYNAGELDEALRNL